MAAKQTKCKRGHLMADTRKIHPNGDSYCYECKKVRFYRRKSHLKRLYGVSPEFVDGKACEICGTNKFGIRRAHVDHDHNTGKVRGILCHSCNTGLGLLGNNLDKAIAYMKRNS